MASPTEAPHGHTLSYPLADGRAPGLTPHIDERGTTKTGEWGTTKTGERTTMLVISTMSFLLTRGLLWCGDGLVSIPYPRCAESLFFGGRGSGRTSNASAGCQLETLAGPGHGAREDTCVKACVHLMAASLRGERASAMCWWYLDTRVHHHPHPRAPQSWSGEKTRKQGIRNIARVQSPPHHARSWIMLNETALAKHGMRC